MYKFQEVKVQPAINFTNKNHHSTVSVVSYIQLKKISFTMRKKKNNTQASQREKSTCNNFHEQNKAHMSLRNERSFKSLPNKFHEQNWFHKKKNQFTSATKRQINMQQVLRTKISTIQVSQIKVSTQQAP